LLFFSCLGHNLPLSSDFFTSAPHATHRLPNVTNHISDLPISLLNLASSPHLTFPYLTSPCFPCSPHPPVRHVLQLSCHASCLFRQMIRSGQTGLDSTLVQKSFLSLSDPFVTVAPRSLSPQIDNPLSTKAVILCFGAFPITSSADSPFHYQRPRPPIYRTEFLGSYSEIHCTASTYLSPFIDFRNARVTYILALLSILAWKLFKFFKPSTLELISQAVM
jgi:hypothetical protein